MEEAGGIIQRFPVDRQPTVLATPERGHDFLPGRCGVHGNDVGPRNHHVPHSAASKRRSANVACSGMASVCRHLRRLSTPVLIRSEGFGNCRSHSTEEAPLRGAAHWTASRTLLPAWGSAIPSRRSTRDSASSMRSASSSCRWSCPARCMIPCTTRCARWSSI